MDEAPGPTPPKDSRQTGAFEVLRRPGFRWLLCGSTISNGAQWIQQVTMGWLVYDLTSSGTMLGTLNLARAVANLGLAPLAGVAIDRMSRRGLMFAVNSWLFVLSLMLGLLLVAGYNQVWPLFVFAFLGGLAGAIDMPLRQTVVFVLVPRHLAPSAVALIQTGWSLMRSIGPAVGGFLILWIGPGGNFLIQAAAYALITLTILQLNFPPKKPGSLGGSAFRNIGESLRHVMTDTNTRAFLLMGSLLPLFIIPNFAALPPIYAKDVFAGGPHTLGVMFSAVGLGGIGGGIVTASLGKFERRGMVQLVALLLMSLALIGFALTSTLWLALLLLTVAGFFEMIYLTLNQTLLQLSIPDEMRGRVTGIVSLNAGLMPVGALMAGVGADLVGPQTTTIFLSSITAALAVVVFFLSPTVREYRLSRALRAGSP